MTLYSSLASKSSLVDTGHFYPRSEKELLQSPASYFKDKSELWAQSSHLCLLLGLFPENRHNCCCYRLTTSAGVCCSVLLPGSLSQWSSSSLSRSSSPVLVMPPKKERHPQLTGCVLPSSVKFKVWLWKRNTNHDGVSIQNHCSIISSSKTFSNVPWSLWKALFNPRKLYWAVHCKEIKIPIHVLANVCEISK